MKLSADGFRQLLQSNVVEGVFTRRHEKPGWRATRRILCTLDKNLLTSLAGRVALNFANPTQPPPYPAKAYNLVVVWDLFWQDWRAIPVDALSVVTVIPSHTKAQQNSFWEYFGAYLVKLTPQQKEAFMNQ
jgi:hypothetical protein